MKDNAAKERHRNPFTDFGFKKLLGEEAGKKSLIDSLNLFLPKEQSPIKN